MFSKCGNPACHTPFGVSGRIFAADAPEGIDSRFTVLVELTSGMRAVHFYWLCDVCCGLIARTASVFGPDS